MGEFVKAEKASAVPPGKGTACELNGKKIAIFNVDGNLYAIDDTCTHKGGPLSEGSIEGCAVACPWHGAVFDLNSGEVVRGPAPRPVAKYNVRVVGDDIEVEI